MSAAGNSEESHPKEKATLPMKLLRLCMTPPSFLIMNGLELILKLIYWVFYLFAVFDQVKMQILILMLVSEDIIQELLKHGSFYELWSKFDIGERKANIKKKLYQDAINQMQGELDDESSQNSSNDDIKSEIMLAAMAANEQKENNK